MHDAPTLPAPAAPRPTYSIRVDRDADPWHAAKVSALIQGIDGYAAGGGYGATFEEACCAVRDGLMRREDRAGATYYVTTDAGHAWLRAQSEPVEAAHAAE